MPRLAAIPILALVLLLSGCMQIDVTVRLEEDGSATITEKLSYTKKLLDLESGGAEGTPLTQRLGKASAQERVKSMGKGARLVSHEVKRRTDGGSESIAVFHIPRLDDIRFVSPYLAVPGHEKRYIQLRLWPCYTGSTGIKYGGDRPGWMGIRVGDHRYNPQPVHPKPLTPAGLQAQRQLLPVFKDLLRGFRLRMYLELYDPVRTGSYLSWSSGDYRGSKHLGTRTWPFIDFQPDRQRDSSGKMIVNNEEIMLDLIRGDWGSERICGLVYQFWRKGGVPIFRPKGRWGSAYVIPSRHLWKKYFEGMPRNMIFDPGTAEQNRWLKEEGKKNGEKQE